MSLVLVTGTMKYRENPNQPWRPLVIKAGMNWESMADTYDPDNGTYEIGRYVLEDGVMYRCIYAIDTPETWTPAHWIEINIGDELISLQDSIASEARTRASEDTLIRNALTLLDGRVDSTQSTEAYVLGASTAGVSISGSDVYVIYNDALYKTTQPIASTDTAPYTGKILLVSTGGGLNDLKNYANKKILTGSLTSVNATIPKEVFTQVSLGSLPAGRYIVNFRLTSGDIWESGYTIDISANNNTRLTIPSSGAGANGYMFGLVESANTINLSITFWHNFRASINYYIDVTYISF